MVFSACLAGFITTLPLGAAMPAERQIELFQRHCAVCHTDAARNGGLTLQLFDAATVDPRRASFRRFNFHIGRLSQRRFRL